MSTISNRYLSVLSDGYESVFLTQNSRQYEIRAGRSGSEIVCAAFLCGDYLDAIGFITAEIEPSIGLGEQILMRDLMNDAKARLTGNLTFR